jgi:alpha-1,6-mannosyltransferase
VTSPRARACLAALVTAYFALAVVAGVPRSPLTVPLPVGTQAPGWAANLASAAGLDGIGRHGLIVLAWALMLIALTAFVVLLREAWTGRVGLAGVLVASGASLVISVAAPLLLSRDVFTYAAYGRISALGDRNPYLVPLSSFPHDPFVRLIPGQWVHGHSHYGPLFTLLSAGMARTAPGTAIFLFKLTAGMAIAIATVVAARIAPRKQAPLAAVLVGLNPVLVVHTVGGGHVDALLSALLAGALSVALTRRYPIAVTLLLTAACLVKTVMLPVLVLWLWSRRPGLTTHVAVVAAATAASLVPFTAGWRTFRPLLMLGGVEAWASPSHLVGRAAAAVVGGWALGTVEVAFLLAYLVLLRDVARRWRSPADAWGIALLVLALSMPYLLPWYVAWFAPFLGLFADGVLRLAGAIVSGVLALTLIPADPFHGLTTPAVMNGVHYGAAPVLLVVLGVAVSRLRSRPTMLKRLREPATTGAIH